MILLTDEEIRGVMQRKFDNPRLNFTKELNKAQLKKVVELIEKNKIVTSHIPYANLEINWHLWQSLLDEVEGA